MDRQFIADMWDAAHDKYTWFPPFASFRDLTPQHAAWKPDPKRHSAWQILNHIIFWREVTVRRLGGEKISDAEVERRNFEEPAEVAVEAWHTAVERLENSRRLVRDAILNEKNTLEALKNLLPHDAYHLGQVMYLCALQGLPPVEG